MSKKVLAAGVAVVAAAAVLMWWILRDPDETGPQGPGAGGGEIRRGTMSPLDVRRRDHERWPYADFLSDFADLRKPEEEQTPGEPPGAAQRRAAAMFATKFPVKLEKATVGQLVDYVKSQLEPKGFRVITYPNVQDDPFEFTYDVPEVALDKFIDAVRADTGDRVRYWILPDGICIGTEAAIQQAQWDLAAEEARRRAEKDPKSSVLDRPFRPDFADAWIGPIHRILREQTGAEFVIDEATWRNGRTLTWRGPETTLREALNRICREMQCVWRVKDDRVYLYQP